MRRLFIIISVLFFAFALLFPACGGMQKSQMPLETLKAYNQASKEKDAATMKSLLSKGSMKMAQDEAKAQNVAVDEIVQREPLYSPGQTTVKIRNQQIAEDQASIEIENSYGTWDKVFFVKEDGEWKVAKERAAEEILKQVEEENKKTGEEFNQSRQQQ
ncbi:MAG: nuclear transport factor 2 family protein [Pyrinomonadaceae bacterium]